MSRCLLFSGDSTESEDNRGFNSFIGMFDDMDYAEMLGSHMLDRGYTWYQIVCYRDLNIEITGNIREKGEEK